jgi:hypothetical protein
MVVPPFQTERAAAGVAYRLGDAGSTKALEFAQMTLHASPRKDGAVEGHPDERAHEDD